MTRPSTFFDAGAATLAQREELDLFRRTGMQEHRTGSGAARTGPPAAGITGTVAGLSGAAVALRRHVG